MSGKLKLTCAVYTGDCSIDDVEFELPEGAVSRWHHDREEPEIEVEGKMLCAEHAAVQDFFWHNCPGCVAGFPDCGLGGSYQRSNHRTLTIAQHDIVRSGVCPFRVNGSFTTTVVGNDLAFGDCDMRDTVVSPEAAHGGEVMADAISAYIAHYPTRERASW